ncbi:MAG: endolytic transglycosylase MltG [Eubacterium sp.]|nr:endolytic transglycosylase MltG [Eubacterium sp.]
MAGQTEKGNATVLLVIRGILILVLNMIFYVVIVFATVEICKFTYSFANEVFGEVMAEAPPGEDKVFVIQKAEDSLTISKNLEREGIVPNAYSFYIRLKLSLSDTNIVAAGSYNLNTSMTYKEILGEIVKKVSTDGKRKN